MFWRSKRCRGRGWREETDKHLLTVYLIMHLSFFGNLIYCTVFTLLYFTLLHFSSLHFSYYTLPYRTILYFKKCVIYLHCSDHYHCKWMTAILIYFTAPKTACPRNDDSSTLHMSYDTESALNDTVTEHNTTQHNTKWRNDDAYSSSAWCDMTKQRDATWRNVTTNNNPPSLFHKMEHFSFLSLSIPFLPVLFISFPSFARVEEMRRFSMRCTTPEKGKDNKSKYCRECSGVKVELRVISCITLLLQHISLLVDTMILFYCTLHHDMSCHVMAYHVLLYPVISWCYTASYVIS